jgi:octaprenyl-diphosphate synthase
VCYSSARIVTPSQAPLSASLDPIRALIAPDIAAVDAVIRRRLDSDVALIRQVAEYIIGSGGKRLRPTVLLLSAGACGYDGTHHHELAAVIEFIHTATLLHDDVVDESELRRGRQTANAVFGNPASVLVGDFLYSRAFQMMVGVSSMRVMEVLADATNTIAEGEVMQLLNVHHADVAEAAYLDVIRRKTAKLFEAAARLGAVLSGASPAVEDGLAAYGIHLGTAFQLVDDVLDYSGDLHETGKNLGDDLNEGKPTLPLIYAMRHGSPEQAQIVRHAVEHGGRDDFGPVLEAIRATGALEFARQQARREAQSACDALKELADSNHRQSLLNLAAFAAERNY